MIKYFKSLFVKRDDDFYEKLLIEGREHRGQDIKRYFSKLSGLEATRITLVGTFEINGIEFEKAKNEIVYGNYEVKFSLNNISEDVILLFQICTADLYYVLAIIDRADFELPTSYLWFQTIDNSIEIRDDSLIYYP